MNPKPAQSKLVQSKPAAKPPVKAQTKTAQPASNKKLLYGALAVVALAAGFAIFAFRPRTKVASVADTPVITQSSEAVSESPAVTFTINGQEMQSLELATSQARPLSVQPLSSISSSQISNVSRQGSSYLVNFVDGSQTVVSQANFSRLPGDVQFQAEYSRER
jgi:hypothetical protein